MNPSPTSKTRSDSTIDSRLDSLQAELFFERLENGLSLREGVAWLLAEHKLTLSEMSLSRWAAKRRRLKIEANFAAALEILEADRAQAAALADVNPAVLLDDDDEYLQGSLLLAKHALFVALRDGKVDRIASATRTVTALQNSYRQSQRAEARQTAASRTFRRQFFLIIKSVIEFERREGILTAEGANKLLLMGMALFGGVSDLGGDADQKEGEGKEKEEEVAAEEPLAPEAPEPQATAAPKPQAGPEPETAVPKPQAGPEPEKAAPKPQAGPEPETRETRQQSAVAKAENASAAPAPAEPAPIAGKAAPALASRLVTRRGPAPSLTQHQDYGRNGLAAAGRR